MCTKLSTVCKEMRDNQTVELKQRLSQAHVEREQCSMEAEGLRSAEFSPYTTHTFRFVDGVPYLTGERYKTWREVGRDLVHAKDRRHDCPHGGSQGPVSLVTSSCAQRPLASSTHHTQHPNRRHHQSFPHLAGRTAANETQKLSGSGRAAEDILSPSHQNL